MNNFDPNSVHPPYKHQEYPKFQYHATKQPVIVQNEEQLLALGEGWTDRPQPPVVDSDESWQASEAVVNIAMKRGRKK